MREVYALSTDATKSLRDPIYDNKSGKQQFMDKTASQNMAKQLYNYLQKSCDSWIFV